MSGLYFITPDTIAHISMVPQKLVDAALVELSQKKLIFMDRDRDLIFVKSMFKRQYLDLCWRKGPSESVLRSIAKHLATLNDSPLISLFLQTYKTVPIPYTNPAPQGEGDGGGDGPCTVTVTVTGTEQPPSYPPPSGVEKPAKAKTASHDPEKLSEALSGVNQADLFREFEPQGLDVKAWWDDFCDYVLTGGAKGKRPNPANWVDFTKAAKASARGAIAKGLFIKGRDGPRSKPPPEPIPPGYKGGWF
jgi:hypothetical protein